MRVTARRKQEGGPLRDAITASGLGLQGIAARTRDKDVDPAGKGVSFQLIGFLTQDPSVTRHARTTTSPETTGLIEKALGVPSGSLFEVIEAPSRSDPQPAWEDLQPAQNVTAT
jgi:hypothetical protein